MNNNKLEEFISEKLELITVKISDNPEKNKVGTGFFITTDGYILTAYHCIKPAILADSDIYVTLKNIEEPLYGQYKNELSVEDLDIAVLKVDHQIDSCIPLGCILENEKDKFKRTKVLGAGYPGFFTNHDEVRVFPEGRISAFIEREVEIEGAIQGPGQSGGPIYHYDTRQIFALATKTGKDGYKLGHASPFNFLFQKWEQKWKEFKENNEKNIERWKKVLNNFEDTNSQKISKKDDLQPQPKNGELKIMSDSYYAIGVDVGTAKIAAGLVKFPENGSQPIVSHPSRSSHDEIGKEKGILDRIISVINDRLLESGISKKDIKRIGVGLPGQVNYLTKQLQFAPGLKLRNTNISRKLEVKFGCEIFIDNDVNCSTLAELHCGNGVHFDNFVCIFIGTGIGAGVVINKQLFRGSTFSAGEVGHMKIDCSKEARICTCGSKGCFEEYASARAIIRLARDQIFLINDRKIDSSLATLNPTKVTPEDIVEVIKQYPDDEHCIELVKQVANYLAIGISNIANVINPNAIILGGGIIKGFYDDIDSFRIEFDKIFQNSALDVCRNVEITTAALVDDAPIIGAALLGQEKQS